MASAMAANQYYGTGRRKTSTARVFLRPGKGEIIISKGGGVFSRSAKSIQLTPEIKAVLDIAEDALDPVSLIRAIFMSRMGRRFPCSSSIRKRPNP